MFVIVELNAGPGLGPEPKESFTIGSPKLPVHICEKADMQNSKKNRVERAGFKLRSFDQN
jgi:hypothetical protein